MTDLNNPFGSEPDKKKRIELSSVPPAMEDNDPLIVEKDKNSPNLDLKSQPDHSLGNEDGHFQPSDEEPSEMIPQPSEKPSVESNVLPRLNLDEPPIHEDMKPIIQMIFDGGIHSSRKHWEEREIIAGEPIEGVFDAMKSYQDAGYHIHIYSDRAQSQTGLTAVFNWMDQENIDLKCLHRCSISDTMADNAVVTVKDKSFPVMAE